MLNFVRYLFHPEIPPAVPLPRPFPVYMATYHLTSIASRIAYNDNKWVKLSSFITWLDAAEDVDPTVRAARNNILNRLTPLCKPHPNGNNLNVQLGNGADDLFVYLGDEPFRDILTRLRTVLRSRNSENAALTNRAGVVTRPGASDNDNAMSYFYILQELRDALIDDNIYGRAKYDIRFEWHA